MKKVCKQCGDTFYAEESWKKICLGCWIDNKNKEGSSPPRKQAAPSIPEDMLKTLINLCHPDRHGGKDAATRATQYLLSLRGK